MRPKAAPWSKEDEAARVQVSRLAEALGVKQVRMAKAAGVSKVYLGQWLSGGVMGARLDSKQLAGIMALFEMPEEPGGSQSSKIAMGDGGKLDPERAIEKMLKSYASTAGSVPKDQEDAMRYLARKNAAAIFGQAIRLMVGAKSEMVRARMVEFLTERGFGRAAQAMEDRAIKAPLEDAEFLDMLVRLARGGDVKPKKDEKKAEEKP